MTQELIKKNKILKIEIKKQENKLIEKENQLQ